MTRGPIWIYHGTSGPGSRLEPAPTFWPSFSAAARLALLPSLLLGSSWNPPEAQAAAPEIPPFSTRNRVAYVAPRVLGSSTGPLTTVVEVCAEVTAGSDDATEVATAMFLTAVSLGSNLDATDKWAGMRFLSLAIPKGATIHGASLHVVPDSSVADEPQVTIFCQDADNPSTFTTDASDISSRPRTAGTPWDNPNLGANGTTYFSVDIRAEVQAVVNRSGWSSGNALVVIIQGGSDALRDLNFKSFENISLTPPKLCITYLPADQGVADPGQLSRRRNRAPPASRLLGSSWTSIGEQAAAPEQQPFSPRRRVEYQTPQLLGSSTPTPAEIVPRQPFSKWAMQPWDIPRILGSSWTTGAQQAAPVALQSWSSRTVLAPHLPKRIGSSNPVFSIGIQHPFYVPAISPWTIPRILGSSSSPLEAQAPEVAADLFRGRSALEWIVPRRLGSISFTLPEELAPAGRHITGLDVPVGSDGLLKIILNVGSVDFTIDHESAFSTPERRFFLPGNVDWTVSAGHGGIILYDSVSLRWRNIARAP